MAAPHSPSRFETVRWSIFAVLVLAYMSVYFHRMATGVVASDLISAFHATGAALGSLAAMYYYVYTVMQIPAGVLADTVGTRWVATAGNLIAGVGSLLFGLADSFEMAALGRFLVGLGVSVVFVGLMKSNTLWFSERWYGLVSGLTIFLGNMGSVLAAAPLALALDLFSWRQLFVAIGIGSLALALLTLLVVRNRPEEAGFPSLREMEGKPAHRPPSDHWWRGLRTVAARRAVWPGFWVNFGVGGGLFSFVGLWAIPLLRDGFGLDRAGASHYTTVALFALALGALSLGAISDRLGRRRPVLIAAAALYALAIAALLFLPWRPGPFAFALFALAGFSGAAFMVTYPCAKEVCDPAHSGMALSLVNTGLFLGAAIMQPLFGWALDLGWQGGMEQGMKVYTLDDYRLGLSLMLAFALLGLAAGLRIEETYGRQLASR